jgi:1,4-dihydroxy-2-naphthoate polyprenyltransferase
MMKGGAIYPLAWVIHRSVPWMLAVRPKTLGAAVVPVAVGTALAARLSDWQIVPALLCLVFALLVQIGTNFTNDYFDFIKGADTADRVGPTRVVAAGLVSLQAMRRAIVVTFVVAFLVGSQLLFYGGWGLVVVGMASILFGLAYTAGPFPLAYNGLGDVFVFIFFGWVAVVFTFYVQTGFFVGELWLAGSAIGALATNILVINNARDRLTDEAAGKRTLVVRYGQRFAIVQYGLSIVVGAVVPVLFWAMGFGGAILLPLLSIIPSGVLWWQFARASSAVEFGGILGKTGAVLMLYGLLFSIGLWVS